MHIWTVHIVPDLNVFATHLWCGLAYETQSVFLLQTVLIHIIEMNS